MTASVLTDVGGEHPCYQSDIDAYYEECNQIHAYFTIQKFVACRFLHSRFVTYH
ncbi:hypothetical protein GGQ79_004554 [Ochrobactrum pecoris]|uniref:Uncharacterized protein n=1 Tax=Brucella pecoris TaxID=867683 RepID=A0AB34YXX1_9HYPH|nr:hypothetical protein [Brucella pecoris]